MAKRMLVDATHPEETRVVVIDGNRLEEFDFETASKKQLKGNIYLAKVTRVEPSLQAAFIEYGGNRHGFLAFSEIHPDYYRIPVDDRQQLLAAAAEEESLRPSEDSLDFDTAGGDDGESDDLLRDPRDDDDGGFLNADGFADSEEGPGDDGDETARAEDGVDDAEIGDDEDAATAESVETVGGDGVDEARERRMARIRRSYKIQEVIKRRQILLVQVTKEERGNKGAALTTFLSLAGRYCVLMPNTPRGGGISRKIANPKDRKRMKAILDELDLPEGMAVILRTAGLERTKTEIRRDLDYLLRLWDSIRETTLKSTAPTLIHEEANLIKRAIRDLYSKDIDEIDVAGEDGYRAAKDFMRMLVPSHARKVRSYREDAIPLFQRYQIETQIDAMHSPTVQLKSGGYIVINPTEALVAIDVNSGRATRERNIEETAYRTNLEAAEEVARQLRLRDLAGLIVIDFIDMEQDRHNNAVERKLKDALRHDRARIQVGRISHFGLLEMSRQRLRPSLVETHFDTCPRCKGVGLMRSIGSSALHILRTIEEEGIRQRAAEITVTVPTEIALYLLNDKRDALVGIEQRYGFRVLLRTDDTLIAPDHRLQATRSRGEADAVLRPAIDAELIKFDVDEDEADRDADEAAAETIADGEEQPQRRKRRSRRGRRRRDEAPREGEDAIAAAGDDDAGEPAGLTAQNGGAPEAAEGETQADGDQRKKRRRGRRGGRRRSGGAETEIGVETGAGIAASGPEGEARPAAIDGTEPSDEADRPEPVAVEVADPDVPAIAAEAGPHGAVELETVEPETVEPEASEPEPKPKRKRASRAKKAADPSAEAADTPAPAKPRRRSRRKADADVVPPAAEAEPTPEPADSPAPEPAALEIAAEASHSPGRSNGAAPAAERDGDEGQQLVKERPGSPRRGWWRRVLDG